MELKGKAGKDIYKPKYKFPKISSDILDDAEWNSLKMSHLENIKLLDDLFSKLEDKRTKEKLTDDETKVYFYTRSLYVRTLIMLFAKEKIESNFIELKNLPSLFKQYSLRLANKKAKVKFFINYHLYNFYLNFSAILDNLAWLLNYSYHLGFKEKNRSKYKCTLMNEEFLGKLKDKSEEIVSAISRGKTKKWLDDKYLKRHISAHRQIIDLAEVFVKQKACTMLMAHMKNGEETIFYDVLSDIREISDKLIDLIVFICGKILNRRKY